MSLRPQIVCGAELFVVRELPARHRTRGVSSCRGSPNGAAHSQIAAKLVQGRSDAAGPVAPNRARNISLHPTLAEGIGAMLATTAAASTSTSTSPTPAPSLWVPRPRRTHATLRRARLRGIHGQACASLGQPARREDPAKALPPSTCRLVSESGYNPDGAPSRF